MAATIKLRHYRLFTACRFQAQGLFTALYTETCPGFSQACLHDLHDKCAGVFGGVINRFSTSYALTCQLVVPIIAS
jgi:hypothetical protein